MLRVSEIRSKNYEKNEELGGDGLPCVVCGKWTDKPPVLLHLCHGGSMLVTEGECDQKGCLHGYPVGSECWRKYKKILEPYVFPAL